MNEIKDHISNEAMRQYIEGRMTGKEMHAFEKHLLACDFCNDAFEGYQLDRSLLEDKVQQRLLNKVKEKGNGRKVPFMAIAASLALLIGVSVVFTYLYFDNQTDQVSQLDKKKETKNDELLNVMDSIKARDELANKKQASEKHLAERITKKEQETALESETEEEVEHVSSREAVAEEVDEINSTKSFSESDEAFASEDSEKVETEVLLEEMADVDVFGENDESLEEQVMEPMPVRAKSAARMYNVAGADASSILSSDQGSLWSSQNAVPVVGFDSYRLYLSDSLRYPPKAREDGIEGQVILKFNVTKKQEVVNLSVIKRLNDACDQEAIRLLTEGSKWTLKEESASEDQNDVTLTVVFSL